MLPKEACCKSSGPAQVSKLAEMVTGMQDSRSHWVSLSRGTVMYSGWCLSWVQKHLPASVSHSEQMPLAGSAQWLAQTFGGEICNPLAVCGFRVIWIIWTCFWRKNVHADICTLIWCKRTIENITTMPVIQIVLLIQIKIKIVFLIPVVELFSARSQAMQMQRHRVGAVEPQLFGCKGEDTAATMVQHGGRRNLSFVALRTTVSHRSGRIWRTTPLRGLSTTFIGVWCAQNLRAVRLLHTFTPCIQ